MIEERILQIMTDALPDYCLCSAGRPAVKDDHIHVNEHRVKIPLERPVIYFEQDVGFDNPKGYGHNEYLKDEDLANSEFVYEQSAEAVDGYSIYCWIPTRGKYGGELTRGRIFKALRRAFAFEDGFTFKFSRNQELPEDEGVTQSIYELTYTGTITKERREVGYTDIGLSPSFE